MRFTLWSQRILLEAQDAIEEIRPDIPKERIAKRFAAMNQAFEDALVSGWEALEPPNALPDPNDRHVVSAALAGRADGIITMNLRDFPGRALEPFGLEVIHPDDFLMDQLDLVPGVVLDVLQEQSEHARNPQLNLVDLVARLARAGVPNFADEIRRHLVS